MSKTAALVLGISLALAACGVGCAGHDEGTSAPPTVSELPEGLTVLSSTDMSVSGAYRKAGHAIYFQTLRGEKISDFYRQYDPAVGEYEMDARFMDEEGNTLVVQMGGDKFIDPTWEKDIQKMVARQRATHSMTSPDALKLAAEAVQAIATRPLDVKVQDHFKTLTVLGDASVNDKANPILSPPKDLSGKVPYSCETNSSSCNWYWSGYASYETHYKCIALCAGHHSSTKVNGSGFTLYSCNHGDCAYNMSSVSCTGGGYGGWFEAEGTTSISTVSGACYTSYNWNSGGGTHNCHDDSTMQGFGVTHGNQDHYAGACQGQNWWKAPGTYGHPCPN